MCRHFYNWWHYPDNYGIDTGVDARRVIHKSWKSWLVKNLPAPSPPGFLRIPAFLKAAQAGAEVGLPWAKEKAKATKGPGLHMGVTTRWLLHFPQGRRQGEAQSGGRAVPAVGWGEALGQGPTAQGILRTRAQVWRRAGRCSAGVRRHPVREGPRAVTFGDRE